MRRKFKISSGFIGLATGVLVGWSIGNLLLRLILNNNILLYLSIILFSLIGLILDIKYPVLVESLSFGFTVLIIFQALWDYGAQDWSRWRSIMSLSSVGLLILNSLTGHLKINTTKRVIKRQLGVGK